jgi:hypothetical protein
VTVVQPSLSRIWQFLHRMTSPLGHNALLCGSSYNITLDNIHNINRTLINHFISMQTSDEVIFRTTLISELLHVKLNNLVLTASEFSNSFVIDCLVHLPQI